MEVDDSQERLVSTSSDGEPATVRRRLDHHGSYVSTDHNRTDNLGSDQGRNERTSATLPAKEKEDDSGSDESFLEVTLTSQPECDAGPSLVDTSSDDPCTSVSYGNIAGRKMEEFVSVALSAVSARSGDGGTEAEVTSSPPYISAREQVIPEIHQQETNTFTCAGDNWKVHSETGYRRNNNNGDGSKYSSETDVSCANSSSGESSSGFYGDTEEAGFTGSLASSADLLEMYENVMEALDKEKLREEDTVNVIGSCLGKVSAKIGQVHEIAAELLSNYRVPDGETIISDMVAEANTRKGRSSSRDDVCSAAGTVAPSDHHTSDEETANHSLNACTLGGKSDISSEDSEQRFVAVKDYVHVVYSNCGRENGNSGEVEGQMRVLREGEAERETVAATRATSVSTSDDDTASTKAQFGMSEGTESNGSKIDSEWTASSIREGCGKNLQNTCKLARTSRRIVSRQYGMMSQISAVAEQRVCKISVTCMSIMNCVMGTMNVVSTALQAKRVAGLCLEEATACGGNAVLEVAEAATSASRFSKEAVAFAERAVQLHEESVEALREAKMSLDGIHFEEDRGRDLSRQVSAFGDEVDKLIQQTANISLEELTDSKCVVESSTGTMSFGLREVKQQSTSIENLTHRCDRIFSDAILALHSATSSSVQAVDATLKALESLRSLLGGSCVQ